MYILKKTTSCLDIYHFLAVMTQCVCMVNTSRRSSSLVHSTAEVVRFKVLVMDHSLKAQSQSGYCAKL